MMKHTYYIYMVALLLAVAFSSCSSTKNLKKEASIGNLSATEYMEELIRRSPVWDAVTAKMSLSVTVDGKSPVRLGGTLRMKRDEVIQLSVTYLLGIEVGRAEISPDGMQVIDRVNKRYVQVSFDELKNLANADLDFHTLQALFLNEVFLPGKSSLTVRDVPAFVVRPEEKTALIEVKNTKRFDYRFCTDLSDGLLKQSHIGLSGTGYGVDWQYDKFRPLEGKPFPNSMQVSFEGGKKPVTAAFDLSRLSVNDDWEKHTTVSAKYEKMDLQDLLKLLLKL